MKIKRIVLYILCVFLALGVLTGMAIWYFYEEEHWLAIDKDDVARLKRMAKEGNGEACLCLSFYYLKNTEKNEYWLNQAVLQGDSEAQSHMYSRLKYDAKTLGRALEFLKKSAEQNDAFSQLELGRQYQAGKIMPRDQEQAEYWFRRAIQNGATTAIYDLAVLMTQNRKDRSGLIEAYSWLVIAAEITKSSPRKYLRERDIEGQQAIIFRKASYLGYDAKFLVRQAEARAKSEGENFIEIEMFPNRDKRCKELAATK